MKVSMVLSVLHFLWICTLASLTFGHVDGLVGRSNAATQTLIVLLTLSFWLVEPSMPKRLVCTLSVGVVLVAHYTIVSEVLFWIILSAHAAFLALMTGLNQTGWVLSVLCALWTGAAGLAYLVAWHPSTDLLFLTLLLLGTIPFAPRGSFIVSLALVPLLCTGVLVTVVYLNEPTGLAAYLEWADAHSDVQTFYTHLSPLDDESSYSTYHDLVTTLSHRNRGEGISLKVQFAASQEERMRLTAEVCSYAIAQNVSCVVSAYLGADREMELEVFTRIARSVSQPSLLGLCIAVSLDGWDDHAIDVVRKHGGFVRLVKGSWHEGHDVGAAHWKRITQRYVHLAMSLIRDDGSHLLATHDLKVRELVEENAGMGNAKWTSFFSGRSVPGTRVVGAFFGRGSHSISYTHTLLRLLHLRGVGATPRIPACDTECT